MRKKLFILSLCCISLTAFSQYGYLCGEEITVFTANKAEIEKRAEITVHDKLAELTSRNKVRAVFIDELISLLERRETRKICCDYMYPDDHSRRYLSKSAIDKEYEEPVFRILFLSGSDISTPNLNIVALARKALQLTPEQEDELVAEAYANKAILEEYPRRDMWKTELEALLRILDEKQLDHFFVLKNSKRTLLDAQVYWNRLKEHGMTNDLDSAKACMQIYTHQMKIKKAADIYAYDDAKKREAWAEIDKSAPIPMLRSYSVNRKNIVQKKGYKGSFTW